MRPIKVLLVIVFFAAAIPSFAQENNEKSKAVMPEPKEITGTVETFSGNILDIKPATAQPAVWVTIPEDMKVDREAIKPGAEVSVEARWATICYVATKAPEVTSTKKAGGR